MPECPSCGTVKGVTKDRTKQITPKETKTDQILVCEKCGQSLEELKDE